MIYFTVLYREVLSQFGGEIDLFTCFKNECLAIKDLIISVETVQFVRKSPQIRIEDTLGPGILRLSHLPWLNHPSGGCLPRLVFRATG